MLDARVLRIDPAMMRQSTLRIGKPDKEGRLGRNRSWRHFASVRFQYGAGRALRYAASIGDEAMARMALGAIDAALNTIAQDGGFRVSVPAQFGEQRVSIASQASAAAFFLSDICPALIGTHHADQRRDTIAKAMGWLDQHQDVLIATDAAAPNRLLINALAFYSCGRLIDNAGIASGADPFVTAAMTFFRADGVMVERGGSDTSYQAVSLLAATDLVSLGYAADDEAPLREFIDDGSAWLRGKIDEQGRLDSSQNTRTCADESFLGKYKQADIWAVWRALAYADAMGFKETDELQRLSTWIRTRPDPCL